MKIKVDGIERIKLLEERIEALLDVYVEDMSASDTNLTKIKKAVDDVNAILPPHLNYSLLKMKMVNSDGTKFTIV